MSSVLELVPSVDLFIGLTFLCVLFFPAMTFALSVILVPSLACKILSSPSQHHFSQTLLSRWSQVDQSDLSAAISKHDSDKLPELQHAD